MRTLVTAILCMAPVADRAQPPAPGDGDIRAVYSELRNQTEVVLTIQSHAADGTAGPAITFARVSSGRGPQTSASSATVIDVKTYAGTNPAPQPQLTFDIDGAPLAITLPVRDPLVVVGAAPDYLSAFTTVRVLERIGAGRQVAADALGFKFELTADQRAAFRSFVERLKSHDPVSGK